MKVGAKRVIDRSALQVLIDALLGDGYKVIGPTVRDEAIVYDYMSSLSDLPAGLTDQQSAAQYHLKPRDDDALFGFAVGPHSWKRYLHPPVETVLRMSRTGDNVTATTPQVNSPKYAFLGVRACEIRAIEIQDRVFCTDRHTDTAYAARRRNAFIIAVNCSQAGGTCFCTSMQTGPKVTSGFDLALTELLNDGGHEFLVEVGSDIGGQMLRHLQLRDPTDQQLAAADAITEHTSKQMGRQLNTDGIKELLQGNLDHPRWNAVAERCLCCGNCTMVCPTCFCTTVDDHSDLSGNTAERVRSWDSCFTMDFSYIHGGSVRHTARSRYRQWMTHKLAHWIDQFGTSGCVGCGRCITWCPVGIDITEEASAIRGSPGSKK